MTIEITTNEAELLIAILTGAEGAFAVVHPPLVKALEDLRPWRSALLQAYLRQRIGLPPVDPAVVTQGADHHELTTRD
jgi:hypothetical protein